MKSFLSKFTYLNYVFKKFSSFDDVFTLPTNSKLPQFLTLSLKSNRELIEIFKHSAGELENLSSNEKLIFFDRFNMQKLYSLELINSIIDDFDKQDFSLENFLDKTNKIKLMDYFPENIILRLRSKIREVLLNEEKTVDILELLSRSHYFFIFLDDKMTCHILNFLENDKNNENLFKVLTTIFVKRVFKRDQNLVKLVTNQKFRDFLFKTSIDFISEKEKRRILIIARDFSIDDLSKEFYEESLKLLLKNLLQNLRENLSLINWLLSPNRKYLNDLIENKKFVENLFFDLERQENLERLESPKEIIDFLIFCTKLVKVSDRSYHFIQQMLVRLEKILSKENNINDQQGIEHEESNNEVEDHITEFDNDDSNMQTKFKREFAGIQDVKLYNICKFMIFTAKLQLQKPTPNKIMKKIDSIIELCQSSIINALNSKKISLRPLLIILNYFSENKKENKNLFVALESNFMYEVGRNDQINKELLRKVMKNFQEVQMGSRKLLLFFERVLDSQNTWDIKDAAKEYWRRAKKFENLQEKREKSFRSRVRK